MIIHLYILEENVKTLFCLQKLLKAARDGNIKEVESCVKNRANLECSDEFVSEVKCIYYIHYK